MQEPADLAGETPRGISRNPPEKKLPRSPKAGKPQEEWTLAIKNGKEFPVHVALRLFRPADGIAFIGALAMRVGKPIEWDAKNFQAKGMPEAAKFMKRAAYRKGWEYSSAKI